MAGTQDFTAHIRRKKEERGSLYNGREHFSLDGDANWARTQAMPFITPKAPPRQGRLLTRSMIHPIENPYEEDGIKRMAEMGMDVMGYKPPPASAPMGSGMRGGFSDMETCRRFGCDQRGPACERMCNAIVGGAKCGCSGGKKVTPRPRPKGMGGRRPEYFEAPPFNSPPDFEDPPFNAPIGGRRTKKVTPRPRPDNYESPEYDAPIGGRRVVGGRKKSFPWIDHVKAYAAKHNVSYKQALTDSKSSYRK